MQEVTPDTPEALSEAFVLGVATAASYFIAFAFEAGAASYYGIPVEFIEVRVASFCIAAVSLLMASMLFGNLLALFNPYRRDFTTDDPIKIELIYFARTAFLFLPFVALLGWRNVHVLSGAAAVLLLQLALTFLLPLLTFQKVPTYREKLRAAHEADQRAIESNRRVLFALGRGRTLLLACVLLLACLAWSAGYAQATSRRDFLVTKAEPHRALLRIYGNRAVFANLTRHQPLIGPEYFVVPLEAAGPLVRERLGDIEIAAPSEPIGSSSSSSPSNPPLPRARTKP